MPDFDSVEQNPRRTAQQAGGIPVKGRTSLDEMTDIGWLTGETKEQAKQRYLELHGQYFDNGVRVSV